MKKIMYILSIGLLFTLLGCGTIIAAKGTPDSASSVRIAPQAPLTSKNEPDMSMDEFNEIKNGMTYEQVIAIVGSPGEIIFEEGNPRDQFYTITYQFKGEKEFIKMFSSAYAQLMFKSGKLITKSQTGIKRSSNEKMSQLNI